MKNEVNFKGKNGFLFLILVLGLISASIAGLIVTENKLFLIPLPIAFFLSIGFKVVQPNHSLVLLLFGEYKGTMKENGFFWVNPLFTWKSISLRAKNMDREPVKVNDKMGNPIMIGAVLVWRVKDTYKAAFEVDAYEQFVRVQSESAVRQLATHYAYDNLEDADAETTLRDGGEEVNGMLEETLRHRLEIAGIEVVEARISYLAYAAEIAGAMLQRQQATAVVAARQKIVEGAVGMVEMALDALKDKDVVTFDEDKKASMVSNLMVVLCSDKSASPVVQTGI